MDSIKPEVLRACIHNIPGKKIAVVGDLMVDRYLWGSVIRISPEAPVPVVEVESESESLGGAANVANNIQALGALAIPVGVISDDNAGKRLLELASRSGFPTDGIIIDKTRPTTIKTRVIAHSQHVVRVDRESKQEISETTVRQILNFLESILPELDAIILEDYNKGLLTKPFIHKTIELAQKKDICITADPKFKNFFEYQYVTVFKPNRKETEQALGLKLPDGYKIQDAARHLKQRLQCENVLITLGERGMFLLAENEREYEIPTRAQKVHDVSGAGDTVIGTLTAALAAGCSILVAATLANFAAGVVVGEVGAVPITPEKLIKAIQDYVKQNHTI
ncbi:MAG: D-glycero-beta-D-manno-heptose-7-phosphate kinase [Calditrichaeota bacterium]|nr:MAG: D-glycero-beta-D-manno-heptose-7-phosphate kinase [Calditrichota bacterium]